nr:MAG: RNA-dependent RNA polymerase [Wufeng shrew picorna-like virus 54]
MLCYSKMCSSDDDRKSFLEILISVFSNPLGEIGAMAADLSHSVLDCPACKVEYVVGQAINPCQKIFEQAIAYIRTIYDVLSSETASCLLPASCAMVGYARGGVSEAVSSACSCLGALLLLTNSMKTANTMRFLSNAISSSTKFYNRLRRPLCRCLLLFVMAMFVKKGFSWVRGFQTRSLATSDILKLLSAALLSLLGVKLCGKNIGVVLSIISMIDLKDLVTKSFTEIYEAFSNVVSRLLRAFGCDASAEEVDTSVSNWNAGLRTYSSKEFNDLTKHANEVINCKRNKNFAYGTPAMDEEIGRAICGLDILDPRLSMQQRETVASLHRQLCLLRADNDWKQVSGEPRCAPYGALLIGYPGIGKTFCTNRLMRAFWARLKEVAPPGLVNPSVADLPSSANVIFARNTAQEFYEGYSAQPVIFFSDLFKFWCSRDATAQQRQVNELAELQDLIDTSPYYPNFAALQTGIEPGKGVAIRPNLVLGTSNYLHVDLKTDPSILGRRFKMVLLAVLVSDSVEKSPSLEHLRFFRKRSAFGQNGPGSSGWPNWINGYTETNQLPRTLEEFKTWPWRNDFKEIKTTDIVPQMITEYLQECRAFMGMCDAPNPFFGIGETPIEYVADELRQEIIAKGRKIGQNGVLRAMSGSVYECTVPERLLKTPGTGNNCFFYAIRLCCGWSASNVKVNKMRSAAIAFLANSKYPVQHGEMISDDQMRLLAPRYGVQICLHNGNHRYLLDDERDGRRLIHIHYENHHFSAIEVDEIDPVELDESLRAIPQFEDPGAPYGEASEEDIRAFQQSWFDAPVASKYEIQKYASLPIFDDDTIGTIEEATENEDELSMTGEQVAHEFELDTETRSFSEAVLKLEENIARGVSEPPISILDSDVTALHACDILRNASGPAIEHMFKTYDFLQSLFSLRDANPFLLEEADTHAFFVGPFRYDSVSDCQIASAFSEAQKFTSVSIVASWEGSLQRIRGPVLASFKIVFGPKSFCFALDPSLCAFFNVVPCTADTFFRVGKQYPVAHESMFVEGFDGTVAFRVDVPRLVDLVAHLCGMTRYNLLACARKHVKIVESGGELVILKGDPVVPRFCKDFSLLEACSIKPSSLSGFLSRHFQRVRDALSKVTLEKIALGCAVSGVFSLLMRGVSALFASKSRVMQVQSFSVIPSRLSEFVSTVANFGARIVGSNRNNYTVQYEQENEAAFLEELRQKKFQKSFVDDFDNARITANLPRALRKCSFVKVQRFSRDRMMDQVYGMCLEGGLILFPRHLLRDALEGDEILCNDKRYPLSDVIVDIKRNKDLALLTRNNMFTAPVPIECFSAKQFARVVPKCGAGAFAVLFRGNGQVQVQQCVIDSMQEVTEQVSSSRGRELVMTGIKVRGADVRPGDCGSILVCNGKIVAFLSAAFEDVSLWTVVNELLVQELKQKYGQATYPVSEAMSACSLGMGEPQRSDVVGHKLPSFHLYSVDDLSLPANKRERTEIADRLDPEHFWCASNCSMAAWKNCQKKFPRSPVGVLPKSLYEAAEVYKSFWRPETLFIPISSLKAAANGYVDEAMTYQVLNAVDLSKSPGKPFTDNCANPCLPPDLHHIHDKRPLYTLENGWLQPHPVLENMTNEILRCWRNGYCPRVPFTVNLKREIRNREQFDQAKTRLFMQPPHHLNLAVRSVLGRWAGEMKRRGKQLRHAIGLNVHSSRQWGALLDFVKKGRRRALGPDFSAYDCSHWSELIMIAADVVASYYESKYRKAIECAVLSCSRFEFRDKTWHVSNAGYSSGSQITTQINCVLTSLLYIAFGIEKFGSWTAANQVFDFVCYGDDCILGFEPEHATDEMVSDMVAFRRRCGYRLTGGDKGDLNAFSSFSETMFLKRRFEFSRGLLRAPLPLRQIFKPVLHYSEDCIDREECGVSSLRAIALEIAELNAKDRQDVLDKLRAACSHPVWRGYYDRCNFEVFLETCERMKPEACYGFTSPNDLTCGANLSDGSCEWAL